MSIEGTESKVVTPAQVLIKNMMLGIRDPKQNDGKVVPFTQKDISEAALVIYSKIPPSQFFADLNEVYEKIQPEQTQIFLENLKHFIKENLKKDTKFEFHEQTLDQIQKFAAHHNLPKEFLEDINQTVEELKQKKITQDAMVAAKPENGKQDLNDFVNNGLAKKIDKAEVEQAVDSMVHDLRQLQQSLYRDLSPSDFYNKKWDKKKDLSISKMIKSFDGLASMVVKDIIHGAKNKEHQKAIFGFYAKVAARCVETGDFQSAAAIFGALNHSAVARLKYLDAQPELGQILQRLNTVFSPTKANKGLREEIAAKEKEPGIEVIPWVGVPMQDMFSIEETPTEGTSEDKIKNLSNAMKVIFDAQSKALSHNPEPLHSNLSERVKQNESRNPEEAKAKEKEINSHSLALMPRGQTEPIRENFSVNLQHYISDNLSTKVVKFNGKDLELNTQKLAQVLTERHGLLMMKIDPEEIKQWAKTPEKAPNFMALNTDLQNLENMVRDDILMATSEVEQKNLYQFYVKLIVECEKNNNYAAMRAIANGLTNDPVIRLTYLQSGPAFDTLSALTHEDTGLLSNKGDKANMKARQAQDSGFCIPDITITKFKIDIASNYEGEGKQEREKQAVKEFSTWKDRTGMKYSQESVPTQYSDLSERFNRLPLDGDFAAQRSQQIYKKDQKPFVNVSVTQAGVVRENEQIIFQNLSETISNSSKTIQTVKQKSTEAEPYWVEDADRRLAQVKEAIKTAMALRDYTGDANLKKQVNIQIQKLEANKSELEAQKCKPLVKQIEGKFDDIAYLASGEIQTTDIKGYKDFYNDYSRSLEKLRSVNPEPPIQEVTACLKQAAELKEKLDSMISAVNSIPLMKEIQEQFDGINYLAAGLDQPETSIEGYKEARDKFNNLIDELKSKNPVPHPEVVEFLAQATAVRDNLDSKMSAFTSTPLMKEIQEQFDGINYLAAGLDQPETSIEGYKEARDKFNNLIEELKSKNPIPQPQVRELIAQATAVRDNLDSKMSLAIKVSSPLGEDRIRTEIKKPEPPPTVNPGFLQAKVEEKEPDKKPKAKQRRKKLVKLKEGAGKGSSPQQTDGSQRPEGSHQEVKQDQPMPITVAPPLGEERTRQEIKVPIPDNITLIIAQLASIAEQPYSKVRQQEVQELERKLEEEIEKFCKDNEGKYNIQSNLSEISEALQAIKMPEPPAPPEDKTKGKEEVSSPVEESESKVKEDKSKKTPEVKEALAKIFPEKQDKLVTQENRYIIPFLSPEKAKAFLAALHEIAKQEGIDFHGNVVKLKNSDRIGGVQVKIKDVDAFIALLSDKHVEKVRTLYDANIGALNKDRMARGENPLPVSPRSMSPRSEFSPTTSPGVSPRTDLPVLGLPRTRTMSINVGPEQSVTVSRQDAKSLLSGQDETIRQVTQNPRTPIQKVFAQENPLSLKIADDAIGVGANPLAFSGRSTKVHSPEQSPVPVQQRANKGAFSFWQEKDKKPEKTAPNTHVTANPDPPRKSRVGPGQHG